MINVIKDKVVQQVMRYIDVTSVGWITVLAVGRGPSTLEIDVKIGNPMVFS